jgi:phage gp29-like protein
MPTRARKTVVPEAQNAAVAPYPLVDRNPTVLGSNVSMQTVSSAFRACQTGYRQGFVDLLDELLERDPHAHAVISQRILSTAGGRLEITPAKCEANSDDEKRAREISDYVTRRVEAIPSLTQVLQGLLWALYYGVSAAEISWAIDDDGWYPAFVHFIHSRRLAYPDPKTWELHVWDQGFVRWWDSGGDAPTSKLYGIVTADYPGKFIVHSPQLRGDYPTRDGLGREIAYWMVLKGIAARGAGQYLERFGKPWVTGSYNTGDVETAGKPRTANTDDIAAANAAAAALGLGSIASAVLPDSITLSIDHPTGGITQAEFLSICNAEMSKAVVGQTLTTEVGASGGNRALGQVQKEGSRELFRYDAACLSETLKRDLVAWIVKLNFPDDVRLMPQVTLHVDEKPDPLQAMQVAQLAVNAGMPVDADDLAQRLGLKLVDPQNADARRLFPIAPQKAPGEFDADLAKRAANIAALYPPPVDTADAAQGPVNPDASSGELPDAEDDPEDDAADPAAPPN